MNYFFDTRHRLVLDINLLNLLPLLNSVALFQEVSK